MGMKTIRLVLVLATAAALKAESGSRIAEILAERAEKTRNLQPDNPTTLEQRLDWLRDSPFLKNFGEIKTGLRIKVGGLVTGGGFAIGPDFSREGLFSGRLNFRTSAQVSLSGYQKQDLEVSLPASLTIASSWTFTASITTILA
jgi:hypothetical protein